MRGFIVLMTIFATAWAFAQETVPSLVLTPDQELIPESTKAADFDQRSVVALGQWLEVIGQKESLLNPENPLQTDRIKTYRGTSPRKNSLGQNLPCFVATGFIKNTLVEAEMISNVLSSDTQNISPDAIADQSTASFAAFTFVAHSKPVSTDHSDTLDGQNLNMRRRLFVTLEEKQVYRAEQDLQLNFSADGILQKAAMNIHTRLQTATAENTAISCENLKDTPLTRDQIDGIYASFVALQNQILRARSGRPQKARPIPGLQQET